MSRNLVFAPMALMSGLLLVSACTGQENKSDDVAPAPTVTTEPLAPVVTVGGAAMIPTRNIIENAVNSSEHTTLVAAVQAAGLVDTLSGAGPFTLFAPTNAAFGKLPAGALDSLLLPSNRTALTRTLTYHVVAGRITAADLAARIRSGSGRAILTTVQGATLTATQNAGGTTLTDAAGGASNVTTADVLQSNGVIHVVDTVLTPPV